MFGEMNVVPIVDLRQTPKEVGGSADGAVARLLDVTEHPTIAKWVQLPVALFLFLVVRGDPESGAFYVYDRRARIWFWVDFDDDKFGGYTVNDFDRLVRECRFLDSSSVRIYLRARISGSLNQAIDRSKAGVAEEALLGETTLPSALFHPL